MPRNKVLCEELFCNFVVFHHFLIRISVIATLCKFWSKRGVRVGQLVVEGLRKGEEGS